MVRPTAAIGTPTTLGSATLSLSTGSSFTLTTTAAIVAGNLAVVLIGIANFGAALTIASVSDGTNTYSNALSGTGVSTPLDYDLELWYVANAAAVASGATVTINLSGPVTTSFFGAAAMAQVSGIATASPYDSAGAAASGGGTNPSATTGTLAQANEIVWGGDVFQGTAADYTEDPAFTSLYAALSPGGNSMNLSLAYKIVAATTAVTHAPTANAPAFWIDMAAPFKGAGTAPTVTNHFLTLLGVGT